MSGRWCLMLLFRELTVVSHLLLVDANHHGTFIVSQYARYDAPGAFAHYLS